MRNKRVSAVVFVAILMANAAGLVGPAKADWDPSIYAGFGDGEPRTLAYAEAKLGREVLTRSGDGHDGKYFFVQSIDPWLLDPDVNAAILGDPVYRSQRILYPAIAGMGGLAPPEMILWTLIVVNVVFLGLGSWAVARIAMNHRVTAWAGIGFALNLGLLFEVFIDGAGIVAFALAAVGAWAMEEDRRLLAAVAFAASALAREVMLVFVGAIALVWLIRRRTVPWLVVAPAFVSVGLWAVYVRSRVAFLPDGERVEAVTLIPFSGMVSALTSGGADLADSALIVLLLGLMVSVAIRAWRSEVYLSWGALGFCALAPFLTVEVWQQSFDVSRALAPLITVFVVEFLLARRRATESTLSV